MEFSDPIIPKKETFIKAKYLHMSYTIRSSKDENNTALDLNRQLWACVRTSHVETTLRLLALGADANYSDPEKGNCPLHVAANENQMLQVSVPCFRFYFYCLGGTSLDLRRRRGTEECCWTNTWRDCQIRGTRELEV
jgi:hypothetical protein